jgi:AcrR family transcriptional regulator
MSLFSRGGYYKTGTRDIARVADVSEVTLFRYFERKEDLFLSALRTSYGAVDAHLGVLRRDAASRKPAEMLERIIRLLFDVVSYSPEVLELSAVALFEMRGEARDECLVQLSPLMTAIDAYVTANMENGTFRKLDPSIVTTGIMLTAIGHARARNCIERCKLAHIEEQELIHGFSGFWQKVLAPNATENVPHEKPIEDLSTVR